MGVFYTAFLTAPHWIAIIDARSLNSVYSGLKSFGIAELGSPVGQNGAEYRQEIICTHTTLQTVKNKPYSAFGTPVHYEREKEFFTLDKEREQHPL